MYLTSGLVLSRFDDVNLTEPAAIGFLKWKSDTSAAVVSA